MKRILRTIGLSLPILALSLFAADYLFLRYKITRKQAPFGTVTVYRYYAIEEKNRKTEYLFDRAEVQTCVRSWFPHLGYTPCWYLTRHTQQQVNL